MTSQIEALADMIADQLEDATYTISERLRNAALYFHMDVAPFTTAEWVAACALHDINAGTARNRLNEVRRTFPEEFA